MRTLSYRPRKTRLAGASVLAVAIVMLLYGLFRLTEGAAGAGRAGDPGRPSPADRGTGDRGGAVAEIAIEVGRDYPVQLSTNCGISVTEFGGRRWKAERPVARTGSPGTGSTGTDGARAGSTGTDRARKPGAGTDRAGTDGAGSDGAPGKGRAGSDGAPGKGRAGTDGAGGAPGGVALAPVISGVMRLLDIDTLRFTAADIGLVVVFRPTREPPPACA